MGKLSTTNDPISDVLTRVRNALRAQHRYVDVLASRMNIALLRILAEQGYIEKYLVKEEGGQNQARIFLKYIEGRKPLIHNLKRVSKPSLRRYVKRHQIPRVYGGIGISVLSTSKGVMAGDDAFKKGLGGELLCLVW